MSIWLIKGKTMKLLIRTILLLSATSTVCADNIPKNIDMEKARAMADKAMMKVTKMKDVIPVTNMDISKLPQPQVKYKGNLTAKAKELSELIIEKGRTGQNPTKIKIFISWSIPKASLERYLDSAEKIGADKVKLVFNGLDETKSLPKNVARVRKLAGKRNVAVELDPPSFVKFGVTQVPTIVVYEENEFFENQCLANGDMEKLEEFRAGFLGVSGDVSIDFALEYLLRKNPKSRYAEFIEENIDVLSGRD